jgi:hypothetical protein
MKVVGLAFMPIGALVGGSLGTAGLAYVASRDSLPSQSVE